MKLKFYAVLIIFLLTGVSGCGKNDSGSGPESGSAISRKKYNILLITVDTLRFDRIGVNSGKYVKTPNIDRLAEKSFNFKRAFTHDPITLPSHTNIMTGTTALYHGIADNSGFILKNEFLTIAELLKENKYNTAAFVGSYPLDSRFGLNQGFDLYDDNYGTHNALELFFVERKAEKVIDPAINWISSRKQNWFCWIHLFDPHQPYLPPSPYKEKYKNDLYSGEVAYVDEQLGRLFNILKKEDREKDTVVIFLADHGEALGEKGEKTHAYFAYNSTIHIPMIIHIPNSTGGTVRKNVATSDIFPTICELLGLKIPDFIQGRSVLPLMEGRTLPERYIYFESMSPHLNRGWAPLRGFIKGDDKFIDQPEREFYNLSVDMGELKNIISEKNSGNLKYNLDKLIKSLENKNRMKRADKLDPETAKKLKSLGYFTGSTLKKKKKYTKKDDLKSLITVQNRMLEGLALYQSGKFSAAVKELNSIIKESPAFLSIYTHLANIYKDTGNIDKSIKILEKGINSNPGELSLLSKLGIFLVEANRPKKAVEILTQCIKLRDYDPEYFNYLGVAYYKSGDFRNALLSYRKALKLDTNYASAFNNIASLYLSVFRKDRDERAFNLAVENFNKALEIDKKLSSAHNGLGAAKYFKNDIPGAISHWEKAIESNPQFIDPYFSIGIASLKLGDNSKAFKYFTLIKNRFAEKLPQSEKNRLERLIRESKKR